MIDFQYIPALVKDKVVLDVFEQIDFENRLKKVVGSLFSKDSVQLMVDCFDITTEDISQNVISDFKEYISREISTYVVLDWWRSKPKEIVFESDELKKAFYDSIAFPYMRFGKPFDTVLGEWVIDYLHRYINFLEEEKGMTHLTFLSEINNCLGFYTSQNTLFERFVVARDDLLHSEEV